MSTSPAPRVLVANRGEIAVRVVRAARTLGWAACAIHSSDEAGARHVRLADASVALPATGPSAYLDVDGVVGAAREAGADLVHPGYGFLSESSALARACADAGLVLVGPDPAVLDTFGDKVAARAAAEASGMPVLAATRAGVDAGTARAFLEGLGPGASVMVKAVAGGGGRGIRPVSDPQELPGALDRCRSEALRSFGDDAVYVEERLVGARHVEVQLLGDGARVVALGDRDCSVQRRRQKLVEIAPAPMVDDDLRGRFTRDAVALGESVGLRGVATVELLVDVARDRYVFLEVNPRIQVEHTVTEETWGLDLVTAQLRVAWGATLDDLDDLTDALARGPRGHAVQLRLNAETVAADGDVRPAAGRITALDLPSGPGVRVDTAVGTGSLVSPRYDSLLAKIVIHDARGPLGDVLARAARALDELDVDGVSTNAGLLRALLLRPELGGDGLSTTFVDDHLVALVPGDVGAPAEAPRGPAAPSGSGAGEVPPEEVPIGEGEDVVRAPLAGVVVSVEAAEGGDVVAGGPLVVLEAMKMEHVVAASGPARLVRLAVSVGEVVAEGQVLAVVAEPDGVAGEDRTEAGVVDVDHVRPELAELRERLDKTLDEHRPDAVAKRRRTGHRTARENLADLVDEDSFVEYGALTVAAQRRRRTLQDLIDRTPADGLVAGLATVGGSRCVVMAYDYTVLAGTQGQYNHRKQARLLELARRERVPVVVFAEGGGGRPGDTDNGWITGLEEQTFARFAALSGVVPTVAVVSGRCFAGNAALAGCADLLVATEDASLGMGGPAMIEGGGLGVVAPDDVGPMSVQVPNGVVDVLVRDEAEATEVVRHYLALVTGGLAEVRTPDQRMLRHVVPENRQRSYDVRRVPELLLDEGSLLELRPEHAPGIRTWLGRLEGRAVGVLANNPFHLGGAIDSPAADKMARFLQLCDAHGLPVLSLCDTPGFMVGPEAEKSGSVRRFARVFVAGAKLRVPMVMVVLRKGYGLGAMAMAGGSLHAPLATLAWPTGELGPMGLEGAVRLGFRAELDAEPDDEARRRLFDRLVARAYEDGKALNVASVYEIDGVVDPAGTREQVARLLASSDPVRPAREPYVDTW